MQKNLVPGPHLFPRGFAGPCNKPSSYHSQPGPLQGGTFAGAKPPRRGWPAQLREVPQDERTWDPTLAGRAPREDCNKSCTFRTQTTSFEITKPKADATAAVPAVKLAMRQRAQARSRELVILGIPARTAFPKICAASSSCLTDPSLISTRKAPPMPQSSPRNTPSRIMMVLWGP